MGVYFCIRFTDLSEGYIFKEMVTSTSVGDGFLG